MKGHFFYWERESRKEKKGNRMFSLLPLLKNGADIQDRTGGLRFTRASLYQLSYVGMVFPNTQYIYS